MSCRDEGESMEMGRFGVICTINCGSRWLGEPGAGMGQEEGSVKPETKVRQETKVSQETKVRQETQTEPQNQTVVSQQQGWGKKTGCEGWEAARKPN